MNLNRDSMKMDSILDGIKTVNFYEGYPVSVAPTVRDNQPLEYNEVENDMMDLSPDGQSLDLDTPTMEVKIPPKSRAINRVKKELSFGPRCLLCLEYFETKEKVQQHRAIAHKFKNLCILCNAWFASQSGMRRHIRTRHEGRKDHVCMKCGSSYTTGTGLRLHQNSKHTEVHFGMYSGAKRRLRRSTMIKSQNTMKVWNSSLRKLKQVASKKKYAARKGKASDSKLKECRVCVSPLRKASTDQVQQQDLIRNDTKFPHTESLETKYLAKAARDQQVMPPFKLGEIYKRKKLLEAAAQAKDDCFFQVDATPIKKEQTVEVEVGSNTIRVTAQKEPLTGGVQPAVLISPSIRKSKKQMRNVNHLIKRLTQEIQELQTKKTQRGSYVVYVKMELDKKQCNLNLISEHHMKSALYNFTAQKDPSKKSLKKPYKAKKDTKEVIEAEAISSLSENVVPKKKKKKHYVLEEFADRNIEPVCTIVEGKRIRKPKILDDNYVGLDYAFDCYLPRNLEKKGDKCLAKEYIEIKPEVRAKSTKKSEKAQKTIPMVQNGELPPISTSFFPRMTTADGIPQSYIDVNFTSMGTTLNTAHCPQIPSNEIQQGRECDAAFWPPQQKSNKSMEGPYNNPKPRKSTKKRMCSSPETQAAIQNIPEARYDDPYLWSSSCSKYGVNSGQEFIAKTATSISSAPQKVNSKVKPRRTQTKQSKKEKLLKQMASVSKMSSGNKRHMNREPALFDWINNYANIAPVKAKEVSSEACKADSEDQIEIQVAAEQVVKSSDVAWNPSISVSHSMPTTGVYDYTLLEPPTDTMQMPVNMLYGDEKPPTVPESLSDSGVESPLQEVPCAAQTFTPPQVPITHQNSDYIWPEGIEPGEYFITQAGDTTVLIPINTQGPEAITNIGSQLQPGDTVKSQTLGLTQAVPNYTHQGLTQAVPNYTHQGLTQAVPNYTHQGLTQAMPNSTHQGLTQAVPNSTHQGLTQAVPSYTYQGLTQAVPNCSAHQGLTQAVPNYTTHQGLTQAVPSYTHQSLTQAVPSSTHQSSFGVYTSPPISPCTKDTPVVVQMQTSCYSPLHNYSSLT